MTVLSKHYVSQGLGFSCDLASMTHEKLPDQAFPMGMAEE
jgi:hypothetical protein